MIERTVYISGPISGVEDGNMGAFARASAAIRGAGMLPINPHEVCAHIEGGKWLDYMRADIMAMMGAGALFLLPGWTSSRGARVEAFLAEDLGIPCFTRIHDLERWARTGEESVPWPSTITRAEFDDRIPRVEYEGAGERVS